MKLYIKKKKNEMKLINGILRLVTILKLKKIYIRFCLVIIYRLGQL